MVNANPPLTPLPATDTTNAGSGPTAAPGLGFKARTGSRSSPRAGSRLQSAPKSASGGAAAVSDGPVQSKANQSREQAEKKNQAIDQLRKLLVQGNKRVEALATVIQHLFSEVQHCSTSPTVRLTGLILIQKQCLVDALDEKTSSQAVSQADLLLLLLSRCMFFPCYVVNKTLKSQADNPKASF